MPQIIRLKSGITLDQQQFQQRLQQEIHQMCQFALAEDLSGDDNLDITAELIPLDKTASATLITRESGILCGTDWVEKIFELLADQPHGRVKIKWFFKDGDKFNANDTVCTLTGNARQLLTGERSAMNFLQSLSATASQTAHYANLIAGTDCQLLDTRKTIPGMRFGQKYAVTCGGGKNHRIGLSDAFLIKENHIMACGSIQSALATAISNHPDKRLEIEVENLSELTAALDGQAQIVMLDNFSISDLIKAKEIRDKHVNPAKLEASGNVSPQTIKNIASTGIDFISVGALTKNIEALDLSMRIDIQFNS